MHARAYELKYCERCGTLRVRPTDSAETYCEPCRQELSNLSYAHQKARTEWASARRRWQQNREKPALLGEAELVSCCGGVQ